MGSPRIFRTLCLRGKILRWLLAGWSQAAFDVCANGFRRLLCGAFGKTRKAGKTRKIISGKLLPLAGNWGRSDWMIIFFFFFEVVRVLCFGGLLFFDWSVVLSRWTLIFMNIFYAFIWIILYMEWIDWNSAICTHCLFRQNNQKIKWLIIFIKKKSLK